MTKEQIAAIVQSQIDLRKIVPADGFVVLAERLETPPRTLAAQVGYEDCPFNAAAFSPSPRRLSRWTQDWRGRTTLAFWMRWRCLGCLVMSWWKTKRIDNHGRRLCGACRVVMGSAMLRVGERAPVELRREYEAVRIDTYPYLAPEIANVFLPRNTLRAVP